MITGDHITEDEERNGIRAELLNLTFEELQKLKERMGAKVYNEALFGVSKGTVARDKNRNFKRENKNRPREVSSKVPVSLLHSAPKRKKKDIRDPRFDPLCGEYDQKQFNDNYTFLSDFRFNDIKAVKAELKDTSDPDRVIQLKRLLQRLNNQHRASRREKRNREKLNVQKETTGKTIRHRPDTSFKSKTERRVEELVSQYEDLKEGGSRRIQRHLKRRQQKVKKKSSNAPVGIK